MPPGWYRWRGEVERWWDGQNWGAARRPFADHGKPEAPAKLAHRPVVRWSLLGVLVLVVIGVVLLLTLPGGSSPVTYRTSVGRLCRQAFAQERADIQKQSTTALSAKRSHAHAVLLAHLLQTLVRDSAAFDKKLTALVPPPALRATQQRYLTLERQDSAIYALAIPRLEGRSGLPALNTVTGILGRNAQEVQGLLKQLGGPPCSISPLGLQ
jgi:hypothetical protein